jgi:hypothetical protein
MDTKMACFSDHSSLACSRDFPDMLNALARRDSHIGMRRGVLFKVTVKLRIFSGITGHTSCRLTIAGCRMTDSGCAAAFKRNSVSMEHQ